MIIIADSMISDVASPHRRQVLVALSWSCKYRVCAVKESCADGRQTVLVFRKSSFEWTWSDSIRGKMVAVVELKLVRCGRPVCLSDSNDGCALVSFWEFEKCNAFVRWMPVPNPRRAHMRWLGIPQVIFTPYVSAVHWCDEKNWGSAPSSRPVGHVVDKQTELARSYYHTENRQKDRVVHIQAWSGSTMVILQKGSFQLFVTGYQDAAHWLRIWDNFPEQAPPPVTQREFQLLFEKIVILDYVIRNTGMVRSYRTENGGAIDVGFEFLRRRNV